MCEAASCFSILPGRGGSRHGVAGRGWRNSIVSTGTSSDNGAHGDRRIFAANHGSRAGRALTAAAPVVAVQPQLFRFGLRRMFLFVSSAAALLGAMALVRGGWAVAVGFGAAMIAAHVLATFVGTRLRDSSPERGRWRAGWAGSTGDAPPEPRRLSPSELAALTATPLARYEHAPWKTALAAVGGLVCGAALGAAGLAAVAGSDATTAGVAVGAASCGVMGAWLALLAAHFVSIARRTWQDAQAGGTVTATPRRRGMFRRV